MAGLFCFVSDSPSSARPRLSSARPRLSARKKLLFLALLLGLGASLAEGLARIHVHLRLGNALMDHRFGGRIYEPCSQAYNRLRPGSRAAGVQVNEQGLVGDLLDPDASELQVVALGGSTSFFQDYLGRLAERWRARAGLPRARFASAGTPGYTVSQSLANLRRRVAPLRPDVLVVYHAINDLIPLTVTDAPDDERAFRAALTSLGGRRVNHREGWLDGSAAYTLFYNRLLGLARARRARAYSAAELEGSGRFARDLEALLGEAESLGAAVVLVTFAHAEPVAGDLTPWGPAEVAALGIERHNAITRRLGAERGVRVVDVAPALSGQSELFRDLCHFTPAGRDRLVELLLPALVETLQQIESRGESSGSQGLRKERGG